VRGRSSSPVVRAARAVESFKTAAEAIGEITPGCSVFAITRGQFSMLDAVRHAIDQVGHADSLSLWTWTIADYELLVFEQFMREGRIGRGRLIIDGDARIKNRHRADRARKDLALLNQWRASFGADSIRYVANHAKIATVEGGGMRILLRGSMNLNFNPRFEQLDVSEGGPAFDLVREIEDELPTLPDSASRLEVFAATKCADAFGAETLDMFAGLKRWAK
jgi:hypothetical protein